MWTQKSFWSLVNSAIWQVGTAGVGGAAVGTLVQTYIDLPPTWTAGLTLLVGLAIFKLWGFLARRQEQQETSTLWGFLARLQEQQEASTKQHSGSTGIKSEDLTAEVTRVSGPADHQKNTELELATAHLISLRQVAIHFLLNRPVESDEAEERLSQDIATWIAMLLPVYEAVLRATPPLSELEEDEEFEFDPSDFHRDFGPGPDPHKQQGRSVGHTNQRENLSSVVPQLDIVIVKARRDPIG